jgi:K+/H+ antiporter YhaU regulatory subunit KhtT
MNTITKLTQPLLDLFRKEKTYSIAEVNDSTTDLTIQHKTGVTIQIEKDGTVIVSSPSNLQLRAAGNLEIISGTHIGLVAPRIDLN